MDIKSFVRDYRRELKNRVDIARERRQNAQAALASATAELNTAQQELADLDADIAALPPRLQPGGGTPT